MQISSSHSGINFNSVYKSVVTRQVAQVQVLPVQATKEESENETKAAQLNREALLLKAAQRSSDRTTSQLEALPEL